MRSDPEGENEAMKPKRIWDGYDGPAWPPRAVVFDLDDTLIESSTNAPSLWESACHRCIPPGHSLDLATLLAAIEERRAWLWSDPVRHRHWRMQMSAARRE